MEDTGKIISVDEEGHQPRINDVAKNFINDCMAEKERITDDFPVAAMLLDEAIDRIYETGRIPGREFHADVFKQKLIKVTQKVYVPTKLFPNFNFAGKILGPKGNTLRNLQKETLCKIVIKGRKSMRDPNKEEELRESEDPRHAHLHKNLYVEISTVASPAEAHARIAYALAEIRKYLIPDSNDEVSQIQRKEILADPELAKKVRKVHDDDGGNQAALSILKKVNTKEEVRHEETANANSAPKTPAKKPLPVGQSPFKRKAEEATVNKAVRSVKPRQSILKK